ncbi:MAG TPA: hypothetical protein VE684_01020 [Crenalkalicoccus sp.]|nr:hypothetical protein [Crenalkalicoccus sp.]
MQGREKTDEQQVALSLGTKSDPLEAIGAQAIDERPGQAASGLSEQREGNTATRPAGGQGALGAKGDGDSLRLGGDPRRHDDFGGVRMRRRPHDLESGPAAMPQCVAKQIRIRGADDQHTIIRSSRGFVEEAGIGGRRVSPGLGRSRRTAVRHVVTLEGTFGN